MVVGEGEAVERLGDRLLDDLLEAVAVHPEVVGQALELVRPELLQGVPLALGELKICIWMSITVSFKLESEKAQSFPGKLTTSGDSLHSPLYHH